MKVLREGYTRDLKGGVELPPIYDLPFAVIYGQKEILLLWASTKKDFEAWT